MKKLLFLLLIFLAGTNCQSQEKKFNLPTLTAKDFEPVTDTTENFGENKERFLYNFYRTLVIYGTDTYNQRIGNYNIIGLPDNFNKFKTTLHDPEKSLAFYNYLMSDSSWKNHLPITYQDFVVAYGLNVEIEGITDVSDIFQSSDVNVSNDSYDTEEIIRLERELRLIHEQRLELEYEMRRRYKQERTNSIIGASRLFIDAINGSMGGTIPDYYNLYQGQADQEGYTIQPTLPGTDIVDYNQSGYVREGNTIYRTWPGTNVRDYNKGGIKIEGEMAYPTIPGTNGRDYSQSGYRIEKK